MNLYGKRSSTVWINNSLINFCVLSRMGGEGESVSYIDALFTATTATSVTGLVTLPTITTWSLFGQIVVLILIQIGGWV